MYFTSEIYSKFIQTIVEEKATENLGNLINVISQDNQDRKHRTQTTLNAVKYVFINQF
jgi:hypothetical protein